MTSAGDDAQRAADRLSLAIRVLNRRARSGTEDGGPTRSEQAVLAWLADLGTSSATELARRERVRKQSMAQTLEQLEDRRFILRERDANDRRRWTVSLTSAGREALQRSREMHRAGLAEAIQTALSDAERTRLVDAIDLLMRVVHREDAGDR